MWEKWILLAGLGAITCLMRGTVGEIEACAGGAAVTLQLLDEVVAIVNAVGEPPSDGFVKAARAQLTAKGSPLTSSMFPRSPAQATDRGGRHRRRYGAPWHSGRS
jgi:2-dehydropantoate 2-reductase